MKRLLAVSLIITSMIGFTACGGSKTNTSDNGEVNIKVQVEESWLPYYEAVKERVLAKNENASIDFITVGSFDHLDIIDNTDSTNSDVADVFAFPLDRLHQFANNNVLAPIDAKAMAEKIGGFKDFDNGLGGDLKVDGDYLAFPYNIETLISYVNVENAKAAGLDLTKDIEFTDLEFEVLLSLVHDAWFGVAFTNSANFEMMNGSDTGFKSDAIKNYSELTPEQQQLFESLFDYWKEHHENKTELWDKNAAGGYLDEKFNTGNKCAVRIDGPWAAPNLAERVGSESNLEVLPLNKITVNGNELKHWKSGWGLGVNARVEENEAQKDLAISFIEEIVNPEYAKDLFKYTGKILENVEPSAYEGIDALNKKVIDATYESYENAVTRPIFTEWNSGAKSWENALLSWSASKPSNAEEAYKQVQASFEAMMSSLK